MAMPLNTTVYVQRYSNDHPVFSAIFSRRFQVFSAPNYVDQGGNKGAFVRFLTRYTYCDA